MTSLEAAQVGHGNAAKKLRGILSKVIRSNSGPFDQAAESSFASFMAQALWLGSGELRILIYHAGDSLDTRRRVLDKILLHRMTHSNRLPIARGESAGKEEWICQLCPTSLYHGPFQRVARHITSYHWKLRSWICPEPSW